MPGIFLGGEAEDKAVLVQLQAEAADIPGVRHHIAVEIVHEAVQVVDVDVGVDAEAEELGFVDLPVLPEQVDGVIGAEGPLLDGLSRGGQFPHAGLHPVQQGLVQGEIAPGQDEKGAAEGVFHRQALHVLPARHVVKGLEH